MTTPETLTIAEPGADPSTGHLEKLVTSTIGVILENLEGLTVHELQQLEALEKAAKGRTTLLGAITRQIERLQVAEALPANADEPAADIPASQDFRNMAAADVDPMTIQRPVLTRDGWVCPHPAALPKET